MQRHSYRLYIAACIFTSLLSACGSGGGTDNATEAVSLVDSALSIAGQDTASIGDSFKPVRVSTPQDQAAVLRIDWQSYNQATPAASDYLAEFSMLVDAQGVVEALAYHYEDHASGIEYNYLLDCVIPARCEPVNVDIAQKRISIIDLVLDNSLISPSQSTSPVTFNGSLNW